MFIKNRSMYKKKSISKKKFQIRFLFLNSTTKSLSSHSICVLDEKQILLPNIGMKHFTDILCDFSETKISMGFSLITQMGELSK